MFIPYHKNAELWVINRRLTACLPFYLLVLLVMLVKSSDCL